MKARKTSTGAAIASEGEEALAAALNEHRRHIMNVALYKLLAGQPDGKIRVSMEELESNDIGGVAIHLDFNKGELILERMDRATIEATLEQCFGDKTSH